MAAERFDVVVVGGGVAGRSAAIFTARHDLETAVLNAGSPLLRRNAHLENYPGFPAGVDARLLLDMMRDQAERAGATFVDAEVTRVEPLDPDPDPDPGNGDGGDPGFRVETAAADTYETDNVIAASKNDVSYLEHLDGVTILEPGKTFVETDDRGRTGVDGLYAAGRLARKPHQTVVCAGHGAEVAVTLLEDDDRPFYHDWVAPDRYFTGRGRDLPPGCEEISMEEHRRREAESLEVMREYFAEPHADDPEQHPSVRED